MAELTFLGSYAFTKRAVGPPQPRRPHRNDEGEPPGGILVRWVVSVAFGPPWWWGHVAYFARVRYETIAVERLEKVSIFFEKLL